MSMKTTDKFALGLGSLLMLPVGAVLLWIFGPLIVGVLIGGSIVVLLRWLIRWGWTFQYQQRTVEQQAAQGERIPVWVPFASMLAWLLGGGVALWRALVLIPKGSTTFPLVIGLVGAGCLALLWWLFGELRTGYQNWAHGMAWNAEPLPKDWHIWSALLAIPSFAILVLLSPSYAGLQVWRVQLLGYDSMPVHITLSPLSDTAQRSQRDQAVMQLVEPLLEAGSQKVSITVQGKHGRFTDTAALPARYRWRGDTLEIRLAGRLDAYDIERLLLPLQGVVRGQGNAMSLLVLIQCQALTPLRSAGSSRNQSGSYVAEMRACMQKREAELSTLMPLLRDQELDVQVLGSSRFSPWRLGAWWRAIDLPSGDTLDDLNLQAR